jgi:D-glycero-D-manno-heptose 1,7-bisphosphate phosphatase
MVTAADGGERACVFLDRDGTLIEDTGYVHLPEQVRVLPGVRDGLTALRQAGCLLIVVTNQSGVARGYYDEAAVARCHAHLDQQLGAAAAPDAYYYCPFHPQAARAEYRCDSELRKPGIGMYQRACAEHAIDRERSFMVGDKALDMEFARRARLRAILVGASEAVAGDDFVRAPDFATASANVLACLRGVHNPFGW